MPFETYDFVLQHPKRVLNEYNRDDEMKNLEDLSFNTQEVVYVSEHWRSRCFMYVYVYCKFDLSID